MEATNSITVEPYSPEWWRARFGTFTGSEIWKLLTEPKTIKAKEAGELSETANTYILEKVWEALAQTPRQGIDNYATEWGNDNEPKAKYFYTKLTGFEVLEPHLVYKNDLAGFTGTPDGFIGKDGLIEIKCPFNGANHLKHCFITTDEYFRSEHKEYYWQMQSYMYLTGRKWCDFVSFDPRINVDLGLFIYRLKANEEHHKLLEHKVNKARELFEGHLTSFKGETI